MSKNEPAGEHVRKATSEKKNARIDEQILENIRQYYASGGQAISGRIKKLDKEWDIERVLDIVMSGLALCGITLSLLISPWSLALPILMLTFLIWHAIQGWCPPIPLLRYLKIRTRSEIDREKYALKVLRGDFEGIKNETDPALAAFERVWKK